MKKTLIIFGILVVAGLLFLMFGKKKDNSTTKTPPSPPNDPDIELEKRLRYLDKRFWDWPPKKTLPIKIPIQVVQENKPTAEEIVIDLEIDEEVNTSPHRDKGGVDIWAI